MKLPKVADVKVGYSCNNNCIHCVIANKRNLGDRTTNEYKKEMKGARKNAEMIVITGGEPTMREDIFELVSYAKTLGFQRIFMQTNGRLFSYREFAEKMVGITGIDYVVAIHAHNVKIHDYITRVPGSFEQTVQGIKNLVELKQHVSGKVVISKPNYKFLPDITKLLTRLDVSSINFAFPHPMGNAWRYFDEVVPKISDVAPYVHKAIDLSKSQDSTIFEAVEAIPLCFMQGYDKYVAELHMFPVELRDLDYRNFDFEQWRKTEGKLKGPQCVKCKRNSICEGTWREYTKKYGFKEFIPFEIN